MTYIEQLRKSWESLAEEDALWAICTAPGKRGGKWDIDEFFSSGVTEIETVLAYVRDRGVPIRTMGRALDFGCGVGRLTQALSRTFDRCTGVDISARMIELAKRFNRHGECCDYYQNVRPDLTLFADATFDFIYSSIVLQHINEQITRQYLKEFVRVLRPGGVLVFQLPDYARTWRERLALRSRLKRLVGVEPPHPHIYNGMEMNWITERDVRSITSRSGALVIDVQLTNSCSAEFFRKLEYLSEPAKRGFVSKQYCLVKPD